MRGERGREDVCFAGGGIAALGLRAGALGSALLGHGNAFFLRELGQFHAEYCAQLDVGFREDGFELAACAGRHHFGQMILVNGDRQGRMVREAYLWWRYHFSVEVSGSIRLKVLDGRAFSPFHLGCWLECRRQLLHRGLLRLMRHRILLGRVVVLWLLVRALDLAALERLAVDEKSIMRHDGSQHVFCD